MKNKDLNMERFDHIIYVQNDRTCSSYFFKKKNIFALNVNCHILLLFIKKY